jgi:periplasmic mercuric ion binding protein
MTKYLISVILALGFTGPSAALAAERTVTLAVQNMYCAACPHTVKSSLQSGARRQGGFRFL